MSEPADNGLPTDRPPTDGPATDGPPTDGPPDQTPPTADHGASAERTRLAWRRTGLSATAVGLLAVRPAFRPGAGPVTWLVAAASMAAWVLLVVLAYRRARGLATLPPKPGRRLVPVYALTAAAFAVLGTAVVLL